MLVLLPGSALLAGLDWLACKLLLVLLLLIYATLVLVGVGSVFSIRHNFFFIVRGSG